MHTDKISLEKTRLFKAIEQTGIQRGAERLVARNGGSQDWMIDLRRVLLQPENLNAVAELFWQHYGDRPEFQIAGMEVAAIPLVVGLVQEAYRRGIKTNGLIIRKERKTTGLCQAIEGEITDKPIILIDDLLNSGDSLEKARVTLEHEGHHVKDAFVLIDFLSSKGVAWRKKHQIALTSLFRLSDFGLTLQRQTEPPTQKFQLRWVVQKQGAYPFHVVPKSAPLIVERQVFFGTDAAIFSAIDLDTGKELWNFKTRGSHRKGIWSSAAHHDGRVYFGAYNGDVYCLDAVTGNEIWRNGACEWVGSSPLILPQHGIVIIGLEYERPRMQGSMAALSLKTGDKVWEYPLRVYQHGSATYWPKGDLAICGTNDHTILALHAKNGQRAWQFPTKRSIKYAPSIDHERDLVIAASFDGNIYILSAQTGELRAAIQTDNICYTTPLVTHGRVFCGSGDRHLYVIDLDALKLIEKLDCRARVFSSPRLIDGRIVFGTNGGIYREIDPVSLKVTGALQLPDAITNAVAASPDGKTVIIPTFMNELYCVERI